MNVLGICTSSQLPIVSNTLKSIGALIDDLCTGSDARDTTIVACCSRAFFLEQLLAYVHRINVLAPPKDGAENSDNDDQDVSKAMYSNLEVAMPSTPALLQPTLKILAMSSRTKLVFCPSIPSFRGYMSTLPARPSPQTNDPQPKVVVLDMLALHHGTSEFTVQGLSRSFSLLALVNHSVGGNMQVVECIDDDNPSDNERGPRLWNTEVPLLSGSVKIGEAGQGWATRTISIRKAAQRWFHFKD
ncbi:hypothetical protein H2198_003689 [Neophaeococcomyces mojaviensis]|uniref:Uncharacterized protein n=1 Tax=Neophaeococcomyces mojaviensis TaxID=3383035 RepID=A0ACC3AAJ7_9EURO|nr:hypothetical protein H2198_003689 [Knufia sp. JES_112]